MIYTERVKKSLSGQFRKYFGISHCRLIDFLHGITYFKIYDESLYKLFRFIYSSSFTYPRINPGVNGNETLSP